MPLLKVNTNQTPAMKLLRGLHLTAISVQFLSAAFLALATLATGFPMHDGGSDVYKFPMNDCRIIGGNDTTIEKYPHQVSLESYKRHYCGGSLISANFVVTAAHCVIGVKPEDIMVRAGTTKRENGGILVALAKLTHNPNFNISILDGDIGVLKLQTPLTLSDKIKPISLVPINKEPAANEVLTVTGWGDAGADGNDPRILQVVDLPTVDKDLCRHEYARIRNITETMICAGVAGKACCHGDSGGPLINSKRELVGIVSWSRGCGLPGYPTVYGSVASTFIHNFITSFVNSNQ